MASRGMSVGGIRIVHRRAHRVGLRDGSETVPGGLIMGEPAPDAHLIDLDGNPVRLSDFTGKPLILRFSSRTCSYCYDDF